MPWCHFPRWRRARCEQPFRVSAQRHVAGYALTSPRIYRFNRKPVIYKYIFLLLLLLLLSYNIIYIYTFKTYIYIYCMYIYNNIIYNIYIYIYIYTHYIFNIIDRGLFDTLILGGMAIFLDDCFLLRNGGCAISLYWSWCLSITNRRGKRSMRSISKICLY